MSKAANWGRWGYAVRAARDPGERGRVVQRREAGQLVDLGHDFVVEQRGRGVARAAVYHPVTDGEQVGLGQPDVSHGGGDMSTAGPNPVSSTRSRRPRSRVAPEAGSTTWYFSDDEPALSTSTG